MKAICIKENNWCIDILHDRARLDLTSTPVKVGNQTINGVSGSDFVVYDNVTETSGEVEVLKGTSWKLSLWKGDKFIYNGSAWSLNPTIAEYECGASNKRGYCRTVNAYNAATCSECGGALL